MPKEHQNNPGSPTSQLQANLMELVRQTSRLAKDEISGQPLILQQLSTAYNAMILVLKEKEAQEKKLASGQKRLQAMMDAMGNGVIITDLQGIINFVNPEACNLLGTTPAYLNGSTFHESVHFQRADGSKISRDEQFVESTIRHEISQKNDEITFTKHDGRLISVSVVCTPYMEDGKVNGAVITFQDISEQKRYQKSLEYINRILKKQATTDSLTELYNRNYFKRRLHEEMERSKRYRTPLSIIIFDIDKFKDINDTFGHVAGDNVLQILSKLVAKNIRQGDILARWGGEEFIILVPEISVNRCAKIAEKLKRSIASHNFPVDRQITCSFGVASFRDDESMDHLINRADEALYAAKLAGRNRVVTTPLQLCLFPA